MIDTITKTKQEVGPVKSPAKLNIDIMKKLLLIALIAIGTSCSKDELPVDVDNCNCTLQAREVYIDNSNNVAEETTWKGTDTHACKKSKIKRQLVKRTSAGTRYRIVRVIDCNGKTL